MKLLLTSTGLATAKIRTTFLRLVNKPADQIKIIFVPTAASRTEEEKKYVDQSKQELLNLGINPKNIITISLDQPVTYSAIRAGDVIYVCGGNTFYLLDRIRKTGFEKIIRQFLSAGHLYFGVSAGSIIVGPDISIAIPYDENDVKMIDFLGLRIIDTIIHAHYVSSEREFVTNFQQKIKFQVVPINDKQAFLIIDGTKKIIS